MTEGADPARPSGTRPERPDIVLLAVPGWPTWAIHSALAAEFGEVPIVLEQPVSRAQLLRRRAVRLGRGAALGQALFMATSVPLLRRSSRRRVDAIVAETGLQMGPPTGPVLHVDSVNDDAARALLRRLNPRVVVVNGTRIIAAATLDCIPAVFLNMHAGITPRYRGVHGGYWALAEGRPDLAGTTVHVLDTGIDTGQVLAQRTFPVTDEDNFVTYPYLHVAAGLPALVEAVRAALQGQLTGVEPLTPQDDSVLRHHPTLWDYVRHRRSGVR